MNNPGVISIEDIRVQKIKEFKSARDHTTKFIYTCGCAEGLPELGVTKSTRIRAEPGEIGVNPICHLLYMG